MEAFSWGHNGQVGSSFFACCGVLVCMQPRISDTCYVPKPNQGREIPCIVRIDVWLIQRTVQLRSKRLGDLMIPAGRLPTDAFGCPDGGQHRAVGGQLGLRRLSSKLVLVPLCGEVSGKLMQKTTWWSFELHCQLLLLKCADKQDEGLRIASGGAKIAVKGCPVTS